MLGLAAWPPAREVGRSRSERKLRSRSSGSDLARRMKHEIKQIVFFFTY
jgi:hypothetical protein